MTDAAEQVNLADELPTRLRGLVEDCQSVAMSDALEDAADEIERLRATLAAQQDGARDAASAEREAILHIVSQYWSDDALAICKAIEKRRPEQSDGCEW